MILTMQSKSNTKKSANAIVNFYTREIYFIIIYFQANVCLEHLFDD